MDTTLTETRWDELRDRWERADSQIRTWWDADIRQAREEDVCDPAKNAVWFVDEEHRSREGVGPAADAHTLLYLPFPYISAGGSEEAFPEMYCWDVRFINRALLLHGRREIVRNHILNQLFLIQRYGFVLTGNRTYYLTRSQTPLLADSVVEYCRQEADRDLLMLAYPGLTREYEGYWTAPHHQTPVGLATHRDSGDARLRPELAAEAESLDFTAIYGGDVRRCVPLQLNCALVRYETNLAWIAAALHEPEEADRWLQRAEQRKELIRMYCWDQDLGFFFEYDYVRAARLPYWSLTAYWALWAGVATPADAARMVQHLSRFAYPYGLTQTDVAYQSPHHEFTWLQWGYPCAWAPSQMVVVEGLDRYGFRREAEEVAGRYLRCLLGEYDRTGRFWEKYNGVDGTARVPRERTPNVPLHGWTTAAVAVLGHRLFHEPALMRGLNIS